MANLATSEKLDHIVINNLKIKFYCVSIDVKRQATIQARFDALKIPIEFTSKPITIDKLNIIPEDKRRAASCMLNHLAYIKSFVERKDIDYAVICEDDIHIRKSLLSDLALILANFDHHKLDILLLGYLMATKLHQKMIDGKFSVIGYSYHRYDNELWGTQMYMINKKYGTEIHQKYGNRDKNDKLYIPRRFLPLTEEEKEQIEKEKKEAEEKSDTKKEADTKGKSDTKKEADARRKKKKPIEKDDRPFSADHIITKEGNRAMIYPLLAVEDDHVIPSDPQGKYHLLCHYNQYDKNLFI